MQRRPPAGAGGLFVGPGGGEAPSAYHMEPGLSVPPPLAWGLELLEGCLRAVPEFVRKKTRRLQPLPTAVPVVFGGLGLVLSWAAE